MDKQYYTTGEVAAMCGVSFRTVIRWVQRGFLKANRLPGRGDHRVSRVDLESFLKKNNIEAQLNPTNTGKRALVVEDDKVMARSIERALQGMGFETKIASDGFGAGFLLKDHQPNLLTLDLKMKGIDGFGVLDFLKISGYEKDIKILVISGDSLEKINDALRRGAHGYLHKPFRHAELKKTIVKLIS